MRFYMRCSAMLYKRFMYASLSYVHLSVCSGMDSSMCVAAAMYWRLSAECCDDMCWLMTSCYSGCGVSIGNCKYASTEI